MKFIKQFHHFMKKGRPQLIKLPLIAIAIYTLSYCISRFIDKLLGKLDFVLEAHQLDLYVNTLYLAFPLVTTVVGTYLLRNLSKIQTALLWLLTVMFFVLANLS